MLSCSESESEWSNDDNDYIDSYSFPDSARNPESPPVEMLCPMLRAL